LHSIYNILYIGKAVNIGSEDRLTVLFSFNATPRRFITLHDKMFQYIFIGKTAYRNREIKMYVCIYVCIWPDISVGIATGYGLDGTRIESRWGAKFSALLHTGLEDHPASCTMGTGCSSGVKSVRGVTLTPHPFYCRVQEIVELYHYSPYGSDGLYRASVPVQGCTLPFMYVCVCVCTYTHTHTHSRVSFCDCSFYDDSLLRPL